MINFQKLLILSLCLLLNTPFLASAKEKLVLVTTIDFWNPEGVPFYAQSYYKNMGSKIENIFKQKFDNTKYDLQVKHLANQYDIWQILRSPENAAVFIMAHSGQSANAIDSSSPPTPMIVDRAGFNMTPIFHVINPNLKFLGLLGCYSSGLANKIKKPSLVVKGVNGKIYNFSWIDTLDEIMTESLSVIGQPKANNSLIKKSMGYELEIVRKIPLSDPNKAFPAVRVQVGGKVLGVFPPANPGEEAKLTVFIPKATSGLRDKDLDIILTAGTNSSLTKKDLDLGGFDFYPSWEDANWELYADNDGEAFGVTDTVYEYKGSLQGIEATEYSEFAE